MAASEDELFPSEDSITGQHRKNRMLIAAHVGYLVVCLMYFFCVVMVCSIGAFCWHFLAPPNFHWLTEAQLSKIQSIVFSGGVGAFFASLAQKYLHK